MIRIRRATQTDFIRIFEIEKRSYTPKLQATHEVLKLRHQVFGIWVAELNGKVVGFMTCVPAKLDWPHQDVKKMLRNRKPYYLPWFDAYREGGKFNTLLVSSTAVESPYQGLGVGTALVKFSLRLAKRLKLTYRASALRCEYRAYQSKHGRSIAAYLQQVRAGACTDRFLGLYKRLGFTIGIPMKAYEPNSGSCNYNVFAFKKV